jgi:hypothetical protein
MRTLLSERRRRFYSLVRQANDQPSDWLANVLRDKTKNNGAMSVLARLACLRILACRNKSGLPYLNRKKLVRQEIGI